MVFVVVFFVLTTIISVVSFSNMCLSAQVSIELADIGQGHGHTSWQNDRQRVYDLLDSGLSSGEVSSALYWSHADYISGYLKISPGVQAYA